MRNYLMMLLLIFFLIFSLPVAIVSCSRREPERDEYEDKLYLNVYDYSKNQMITMELEEYIEGVVAAEMPASFHIEALKAQALAARTYTLLRMTSFGGKGCTANPGADICTDSAHCQAYIDPRSLGKDYKKIHEAVSSTKGEVIVYEDKLIDAVFHSTSGGITENSENVWANKVPYLRSVLSEYEEHSPKLVSVQEIDIDQFISGILALDNTAKVNKKNIENEIEILERSDSGRVLKMRVGNRYFSGRDIREQFGLNSTNFTIEFGKNKLIFTVIGYGHGIGMSQYGADGMAKRGATYVEIIKHYYTGVDIVSMDSLL